MSVTNLVLQGFSNGVVTSSVSKLVLFGYDTQEIQLWSDKQSVSTAWGDKISVSTSWGDKAASTAVWTDK